MNTLTLFKSSHNLFLAKENYHILKMIMIAIMSFIIGILTMVNPLILIVVPASSILYGIFKFIKLCNEVFDMKFDTSDLSFTAEEMFDDLMM